MSTLPVPYIQAGQVGQRPPKYRLPAATHPGKARLAVSNLESSLAFYTEVVGLAVLDSPTSPRRLARLGVRGEQRTLLELEELPGVKPIGKRTRLGLYHTAFLLPSRESLAAFVQHLATLHVPFGSADHEVSEALYLSDPDGLGVEVYADRPRSTWRVKDGLIQGGVEPLQFGDLPSVQANDWHGAPTGTTLGHLHFYGDDLNKASAFYHEGLGLDLTMGPLPGALFLAAGGYHHHVGVNVWAAGSPIASASDARLMEWELILPSFEDLDRAAASMVSAGFAETRVADGERVFVDAWGIRVVLVAALF